MAKKMVTYRLDEEMLDALKRYSADDRRSATATVELTLVKMLVEAGYMKQEQKMNTEILTVENYFAEKEGEIDGQLDAAFSQLFYDEIVEEEGKARGVEVGDSGKMLMLFNRDHLNEAWATAEKLFASGEWG